jgi:hypothetical protein
MERQPGDRWAYALYNDGGPVCWHQRRLLGTVASSAHKVPVATPDDDVALRDQEVEAVSLDDGII